jgi:hypothetical protein
MNTREAKRVRDRCIRASEPDTWLAGESPDTVKLLRDAAWTIELLLGDKFRLKQAARLLAEMGRSQ